MVKFYLHNLNQEKRITNTVWEKIVKQRLILALLVIASAFKSFTLLLSEILPIFSNGVYVLV